MKQFRRVVKLVFAMLAICLLAACGGGGSGSSSESSGTSVSGPFLIGTWTGPNGVSFTVTESVGNDNYLGTVNWAGLPGGAVDVQGNGYILNPSGSAQVSLNVSHTNTLNYLDIYSVMLNLTASSDRKTLAGTIFLLSEKPGYETSSTITGVFTKGTTQATTPTTPVSILVSTTSLTVPTNGTRNFVAEVSGTSNTQVNWSVVESSGGYITSGGVYYAPATAGTYHIKAVSVADPSISVIMEIMVTANNINNGSFTGDFLSWTGSSDASHYFTLVRVNGPNGTVTNIGGSDFFPAMAYGPDGTLYGISDDLRIINPENGTTVKIGTFQYQGSTILMCGAAFSPTGTLYVLENDTARRAFTVNLTNAALTYVGKAMAPMRDIEFAPNGNLYTVSTRDLYTLDPYNMSTLSNIGNTGVFLDQLTFGIGGSAFGFSDYPSPTIYSLNLSTGKATYVTAIDSSGIWSLVAERSTTMVAKSLLNKAASKYGFATLQAEGTLLAKEQEIMFARKLSIEGNQEEQKWSRGVRH